jgi:integrase
MTRASTATPKKDEQRGTWYFVISGPVVGTYANGRPRRKQLRRRGFRTRAEAVEAMTELREQVRTGGYVAESGTTVEQWMTRWLDSLPGRLKPGTIDMYRRTVRTHVVPRIGAYRLTQVDPMTLNQLYADLLADGRKDGKGGLSSASVRHVHAIMSKALGAAVKAKAIRTNPARDADPPSLRAAERPPMSTWSSEEVARFLHAEEDTRYGPMWTFYVYTGCRRAEAVGLLWDDVDLDAGRVSFRRSITVVDGQIHEAETVKTSRSRRSISLQPAVVAALRSWRAQQAKDRLAMGAGYHDGGYVFTQPDGRPIHPKSVTQEFNRRSKRHDMPRIRLHDLRHTYASLAFEAGVPAKAISERLGHHSVAFTLDVYAHMMPAQEADYADAVGDLIGQHTLRAVPDL